MKYRAESLFILQILLQTEKIMTKNGKPVSKIDFCKEILEEKNNVIF